ncbi:DUF4097 family beta strand repeat protein [candidate division KSB1 bacterium]|nr:DUF4097 family beta strand repeat protein [candidate division KSB1 bacterium]MBL7095410.1 DUF4097 family beta strand repeat protein [candidate division KSB1 bacterium]
MKKLFSCFLLTYIVLIFTLPSFSQKSREIKKSFRFNREGRVSIDTYKGSITVKTWDRSEVKVVVKIEVDDWDKYAEKKVKFTEIDFDHSPKHLRIKTDYNKIKKGSSSFWGIFSNDTGSLPLVHYEIKMPRTADLIIEDYKSDTEISDLRASVELETYKGTVEINNLEGSIDLETYKGEVEVDYKKMIGRNRFETYKGSIEISLPEKTNFDLDLDLGRRGELDSDFDIKTDRKGRKDREKYYRGSFNKGGAKLNIETDKGEIRLKAK